MFLSHRIIVLCLQVFWTALTVWFELGVFYHSVRDCSWPDSTFLLEPARHVKPTHVLVVADPQILDHRSYPERPSYASYLTQLIVNLNLRKNWRAALRKRPDVIVFLGDMMDGGRFAMEDDEYEQYYKRFKSIFSAPSTTPTYFLPGNHDTGLHHSKFFSPQARARYTSHFGPLNNQVSVADHTLVFLDAPSFVEEDMERTGQGQQITEWNAVDGGPFDFVKSIAVGQQDLPIVLLSHIPLFRDKSDCGPLREKGMIRPGAGPGYQNMLGREVSTFLLETLRPSIILSGDDHDYCEYNHSTAIHGGPVPIREVSVKSLSMAMGIQQPGFQLLSLAPQVYWQGTKPSTSLRDSPCLLPDQMRIYLLVYIPAFVMSVLLVFFSNIIRARGARLGKQQLTRKLSLSTPAKTKIHSRFDYGRDVTMARVNREEYDDNRSSHTLPLPALMSSNASNASAPSFTWSFVLGQRRRIVVRPQVCATSCFDSRQRTRKRGQHDFLAGTIRDIRDIAAFPLTIFVLIALWVSFT